MDALKRVARERGIGKSEAYRELQREQSRYARPELRVLRQLRAALSIPGLYTVVHIHVARRTQRLVVETVAPIASFSSSLNSWMRAQMVGRGRNLQLERLEELLVAAIQQAGDLAVQQPAGTRQHSRRAIRRGSDLRRAPVLAHLKALGVRFAPSWAGATSNC